MSFGLCNAPSTFQRLLEFLFTEENWKLCLIYLDDIIIFAKSFREHQQRLRVVFERLRSAGLKVQPKKCRFACNKVIYLGHCISKAGVEPDPQKLQAVANYPTPTNSKETHSFVGFASYYRRFIRGFSQIAAPLHKLTHKDVKFEWTKECQEAFETLRYQLINAPILSLPDFSKPFRLATDASGTGLGAVLSQEFQGTERVIAFASRSLTKPERNYSVLEREALALVWATLQFRPYLYGREFVLITDHNPLSWLKTIKEPKDKLARWILRLEEYNYRIEYKPGKANKNADALSRIPYPEQQQSESDEKSVAQIRLVPEVTEDDLKVLQKSNDTIEEISRMLISHNSVVRPPKPSNAKLIPLWKQWEHLRIHNGLLYHTKELDNQVTGKLQPVIPKVLKPDLLRAAHDDPPSGHLGKTRTLARLQARYYWPGMVTDVENWCRECVNCSTRKAPTHKSKAPLINIPPPEGPFHMLSMDIVGPLTVSQRGNRYILVVSDHFSKWPEAIPLPNQEAQTVAKALVDRVISQFGVPEVLLTDQGRNFESALFKELCRLLNLNKCRTSAYHPQTDGQTERFNKTLLNILAMYVSDHQVDWDDWIPYALMAYRTSIHDSTKLTPASLVLAFEPKSPIDFVLASMKNNIPSSVPHQFVEDVRRKLVQTHETVKVNIAAAQQHQRKYYDNKNSRICFKVGDRVWLHIPKKRPGRSPKLEHSWYGPYVIVGNVTPVTYKLKAEGSGKHTTAHHNRLKLCYTPPAQGPACVPRPVKTTEPSKSACPTKRPESIGNSQHIAEEHCISFNREIAPTVTPVVVPTTISTRPQRVRKPPDRFGQGIAL